MTIKEMRNRTGLSQSQFANLTTISIRTLQAWERDARKPPRYILFLVDYFLSNSGAYMKEGTSDEK